MNQAPPSTDAPPSSAAQALVTLGGDVPLRATKTSLEQLDDEDATAIGRAFAGGGGRHVVSLIGMAVGVTAGAALLPLAPIGGAVVLAGLPMTAVLATRRELRVGLNEIGISSALVDELFQASTLRIQAKLWRLFPMRQRVTDVDFASVGRVLIDAAKARRGGG
jgi:hypothetical protein